MGHTKWAVNTSAVLRRSLPRVPVALVAEVRVSASIEGLATAQEALPSDVLVSMFLAGVLAGTDLLNDAGLAEEIALLCVFCELQIALAVRQPSVEGLLALVALVEGALGEEKLIQLAKELVALLSHRLCIDLSLGFVLVGKLENLLLELQKFGEVRLELRVVGQGLDGRLARWAGNEVKCDAQGAPLVGE